jgi:hypothetical protein
MSWPRVAVCGWGDRAGDGGALVPTWEAVLLAVVVVMMAAMAQQAV